MQIYLDLMYRSKIFELMDLLFFTLQEDFFFSSVNLIIYLLSNDEAHRAPLPIMKLFTKKVLMYCTEL